LNIFVLLPQEKRCPFTTRKTWPFITRKTWRYHLGQSDLLKNWDLFRKTY